MEKTKITITLFIIVMICLAGCGAEPKSADLSGFYSELEEKYDLPEMLETSDDTIDSYYPELSGISLRQTVVKIPEISSAVSEYVFVECEDEKDVEAVSDILKARIEEQATGGAWYPASMKAWELAEVVTYGNYVAMIAAGDDTASMVADWQALFD